MKGRGKHASLTDEIHKRTAARVILLLVSEERGAEVKFLTELATTLAAKDHPSMLRMLAEELRALAVAIDPGAN
jgi:hypothetical protein